MRILAALSILLLPAFAAAEDARQQGELIVPARLQDGSAAYALAQAEHVVELVRATRTITVGTYGGGQMERPSDLRVSLIVLDLGPSTDFSPRQSIHIAMFNDIEEHGVAWALEPVADVWEYRGVERTAPGIYVVDATIPLYETSTENCYIRRVRITIDARTLSVAVRNAPGVGEFDTQRYGEPIGLDVEKVACGTL